MNRDKFGDSYDIVKQSILRWLSDCGTWSVHPMFTDKDPMSYMEDYCRLLGVSAVTTKTYRQSRRARWIAADNHGQGHLFIDPDTGLRLDRPRRDLNKYLLASELLAFAKARPKKLTLVFDQSIDRRQEKRGPTRNGPRENWRGSRAGMFMGSLTDHTPISSWCPATRMF